MRKAHANTLDFQVIAGVLRTGGEALSGQQITSLGKYWGTVMEKSGQEFNTNFEPAEDFIYDTEPACRALVTMRHMQADYVFDYLAALQAAFYVRHEDITDAAILSELAGQFINNKSRFLAQLNSTEMRAATQQDVANRMEMGVDGFPSLLLRTENGVQALAQGYQNAAQVETVLARLL